MILEEFLDLVGLKIVEQPLDVAELWSVSIDWPAPGTQPCLICQVAGSRQLALMELCAVIQGLPMSGYGPLKTAPAVLVPRPDKTASERCRAEATRSVIFLLQRRQAMWLDIAEPPDGWEFDADRSELVRVDKEFEEERQERLTALDAFEKKLPCAFAFWRTESVWLSREQAEAYAESRSYDYGTKGRNWQVYGVCAEGSLEAVLKVT